ncbi:MAG: Maf family protein, partial [Bacteroidaceae bacterium]|nr:Maf family protein [Bacteroidales bacterium]MCF0187127.1 Maf family protein [Bacteroidaceae bacterium]
SEQEAFEMLRALSGKTHCVTTALTLRSREKTVSRLSNAYVTFAELTDEEIHHYIERYSPLDKAGAYGIQEWIGLVAGTSIHGSFYTIMGLDTAALYSSLKEF